MEEHPLYYICFIDLMGQKDFFKGISSCEVDSTTMDHIKRVTNGLRVMVRYVKNRYKRNFVESDDIGVELFSDSLLLSLKADGNRHDKLPPWLDIIAKVVFIACKYKLPFRGTIVMGNAQRSKSGTIYGTGVEDAIKLEGECVDCPRIILSRFLIDEFWKDTKLADYFEVDEDGAAILNYAGSFIVNRAEFSRELKELPEITAWVQDCYQKFCYLEDDEHNKGANPKLARRYVMWLEYLRIEEMRRNRHV